MQNLTLHVTSCLDAVARACSVRGGCGEDRGEMERATVVNSRCYGGFVEGAEVDELAGSGLSTVREELFQKMK